MRLACLVTIVFSSLSLSLFRHCHFLVANIAVTVVFSPQMGDANASIPTPQPVIMRPMFAGRSAAAAAEVSYVFVR